MDGVYTLRPSFWATFAILGQIFLSCLFGPALTKNAIAYIAPTTTAAVPIPVQAPTTARSVAQLTSEPKAETKTLATSAKTYQAPAAPANTAGRLYIPSIGLNTPVQTVRLQNHDIPVPATIAGAYSQATNKTLLVGHTPGVFTNLKYLRAGQTFSYNNHTYRIQSVQNLAYAEVNMASILASAAQETVVLMTCAGQIYGTTATHRLVIVAVVS